MFVSARTLSPLPQSLFPDTERSVCEVLPQRSAKVTLLETEISFSAAPANNLEVRLGTDLDANGELSPGEPYLSLGWDCSFYNCRTPDGTLFQERSPTGNSGMKTLLFRVSLSSGGIPQSVTIFERGNPDTILFETVTTEQAALFYSAAWDRIQVTARGEPSLQETVRYSVDRDPIVLIML